MKQKRETRSTGRLSYLCTYLPSILPLFTPLQLLSHHSIPHPSFVCLIHKSFPSKTLEYLFKCSIIHLPPIFLHCQNFYTVKHFLLVCYITRARDHIPPLSPTFSHSASLLPTTYIDRYGYPFVIPSCEYPRVLCFVSCVFGMKYFVDYLVSVMSYLRYPLRSCCIVIVCLTVVDVVIVVV